MSEIIFLCAQSRDRRALERIELGPEAVAFVGDDLEHQSAVDIDALVSECAAHKPGAIVASKDRSALLAAIVSERLGLGGPTPSAVINCQHKLRSRAIQRRTVPDATPEFSEVRAPGDLVFPCFVKPVVGRLSDSAFLARGPGDLEAIEPGRPYAREYEAIAAHAGVSAGQCSGFIAEEVLVGEQVTLEGFVRSGDVGLLGVTGSRTYPGTASFECFEYPSGLSDQREAELAGIAGALMPALGFDDGLFNIEFFVPASGHAKIIEVNGRLASQFAPLYEHVHGQSSYQLLVSLARESSPTWASARPEHASLSYCLRVFDDAFVEAVPSVGEEVELLVSAGETLSGQGTNDPDSYRLCIFEQHGAAAEAVLGAARLRAQELRAGFRLGRRLRPRPAGGRPRPS